MKPPPLRILKISLSLACLLLVVSLILAVIANHPAVKTLVINHHRYSLKVANTSAAITKGLGGLASLPENQGMLFSFDKAGDWCFWMKGMRFPLDIIWLNTQKTVIYLKPNVSPKTYPQTFCPSAQARSVIELDAGQIKQAGIRLNQTLSF